MRKCPAVLRVDTVLFKSNANKIRPLLYIAEMFHRCDIAPSKTRPLTKKSVTEAQKFPCAKFRYCKANLGEISRIQGATKHGKESNNQSVATEANTTKPMSSLTLTY